MPLPTFLIIGAMKSGTTTLFRDLETNPAVFFPLDKEPESLCHDRVLSGEGRREYEALFRRAGPGQAVGEASTGYTKFPTVEGVPRRARELLGPDLKLIYIVREPVSRIVSHHFHEYTDGLMGADIDAAVREHPRLIDYSRYAAQAEQWLGFFPRENLRIVRFETYVKDRARLAGELCEFLGAEARPDLVEADKVFNKGDNKPRPRGVWSLIPNNPVYRRVVRPLVPRRAKEWVFSRLLPRAPARPAPPTPETVAYIQAQLADDMRRLSALIGAAEPVWPPYVPRPGATAADVPRGAGPLAAPAGAVSR